MKHFNEEQIKELSEIFGISPVQVLHNTSKNQFSKLVKIKDGVVDITTPTKNLVEMSLWSTTDRS